MFDKLSVISAAVSRMDWTSHRQQVLAQNIANVDTPNYKAHDLDENAFERILKSGTAPRLALKKSSDRHFDARYGGSTLWAEQQRDFYEATLSGNSVNMEENLIKMNQNAMDHSMASNVYRKVHSFFAIAIGKG